ncbi:MAG: hypothetical protein Q8N70_04775, partial [Deltaproteobacteria bacterium]|nr:hypothetical protein [Deltaproteobacteria bacterium]
MQLGKVSIKRLLIALSLRDFYRLFSVMSLTSRVIVHLPYSIRNYAATFATAVKNGFWDTSSRVSTGKV